MKAYCKFQKKIAGMFFAKTFIRRQADFLLELTALGTLVNSNHSLPLELPDGPKSPPHTCAFIVLTNFGRFDFGTSLFEQVMV